MRALPCSTPRWMISAALSGCVKVMAANSCTICSWLRPRSSGSLRHRAFRTMLVLMPPGWTLMAVTPVPRNSWRSESVKPRTANLAEQYASWLGIPTRPNTLDVLTIAPSSCSTRIGRNARVPLTTPWKLMFHSQSSSSGTASSTREEVATPALLNTAPIGWGAQSRTSPAKSCCASASATSSTRSNAGPCSEASVSLRPFSSMSAIATGQLCAESRCPRARPMPDAAPVMTTARPLIVRWHFLMPRLLLAPSSLRSSLIVVFGISCVLLECGMGDRGEDGVIGDQVDDPAPRPDGQIVTEADDRLQAGAWDRSRRGRSTGGVDHPVAVAVDDQRRDVDVAEFGGAVSGREDTCELADDARGAGVPVPRNPGVLAHRLLVERKSVRPDVGEHHHGAAHRLGPRSRWARRRHPPPGRQRRPAQP